MSRFKRYLSILIHYFLQYLKSRLEYKGDFLIALISSFSATVASFGFLYLLFHRVRSLHGWTFEELMFIYGFSLTCLGFFNVVSLNLYEFGERYIMEGRFDQVLTRPLHSLFQILFETFRIESFQEVFTGSVLLTYAALKLNLHVSVGGALLFPVFIMCGVVLYLSVFIILTSVSFWFEDRIGITPPVYNMIPFGRYPTSIYNVFIQFLLSWIIPFAFASFYPTTHFLGHEEYRFHFAMVPVMAMVFGSLAITIWNKGVRNYQSTGN
jgi:ABC-2 type transport system permease protein